MFPELCGVDAPRVPIDLERRVESSDKYFLVLHRPRRKAADGIRFAFTIRKLLAIMNAFAAAAAVPKLQFFA